MMVSHIRETARLINQQYPKLQWYIFGSCNSGEKYPNDIDIMVIYPNDVDSLPIYNKIIKSVINIPIHLFMLSKDECKEFNSIVKQKAMPLLD